MDQILAFKRPGDGYKDTEESPRKFFALERELENDVVLQEIVRRAKEIPRLMRLRGTPVRYPANQANREPASALLALVRLC